jgi:hypothetical protein
MVPTSSRIYREGQQIRRTIYRRTLFSQPDRLIIIDATARECAPIAKNGEFTPLSACRSDVSARSAAPKGRRSPLAHEGQPNIIIGNREFAAPLSAVPLPPGESCRTFFQDVRPPDRTR